MQCPASEISRMIFWTSKARTAQVLCSPSFPALAATPLHTCHCHLRPYHKPVSRTLGYPPQLGFVCLSSLPGLFGHPDSTTWGQTSAYLHEHVTAGILTATKTACTRTRGLLAPWSVPVLPHGPRTNFCIDLLSIAVIQTVSKSDLEWKGFISGSRGRGSRQEMQHKPWRNAAYWLVSSGLLS